MHISPERTSFFGFFNEEEDKQKKNNSIKPLKRNFESSQSPKRELAQAAYRNLTPYPVSKRSDFIDLIPNNGPANDEYPKIDSPLLKNKKTFVAFSQSDFLRTTHHAF